VQLFLRQALPMKFKQLNTLNFDAIAASYFNSKFVIKRTVNALKVQIDFSKLNLYSKQELKLFFPLIS
jgi:hypothetical protein